MEYSNQDLQYAIDAIDRISAHKNRPNLPRIARYLFRVHDFSSDKTIKILDILLAKNRVKEVVYKGNISYRNPLKWKWKRNFEIDITPSLDTENIVVSTISQINTVNFGLVEVGVTEAQLEKAVFEKTEGKLNIEEIRDMIKSELEMENISKNRFGNYVLGLSNEESDKNIEIESSEESEVDSKKELDSSLVEKVPEPQDIQKVKLAEIPKPEAKVDQAVKVDSTISTTKTSLRKGDRIIRKKTKYDPSEYFFPPLVRKKKEPSQAKKAKRGRPIKEEEKKKKKKKDGKPKPVMEVPKVVVKEVGEEPKPPRMCCVCQQQTDVTLEILMACDDCSAVVHETCVDKDKVGAKWLCLVCQPSGPTCLICNQPASKVRKPLLGWIYTLDKEGLANVAGEFGLPMEGTLASLRKRVRNHVLQNLKEEELVDKESILVMCDTCDGQYHPDCHKPAIKLPLESTPWTCHKCPAADVNDLIKYGLTGACMDLESTEGTHAFCLKDGAGQDSTDESNEGPATTPTEPTPATAVTEQALPSPVSPAKPPTPKCRDGKFRPDEAIPCVDDWSSRQVCDYFSKELGADIGLAFLSQEIDGRSLKLMNRADVVRGLGLKLGQALKVLYYTNMIKYNTNDLRLLWR